MSRSSKLVMAGGPGGRCRNRFLTVSGGGKSELRRAVCRITSGMRASRPVDGQCHRKHTASATPHRDHVRGIAVKGHPGAPAEFSRLVAPVPG